MAIYRARRRPTRRRGSVATSKIQPTDAGLNYLRNPRFRFELQEAAFQRGVALAQEKADAAFDLGHDGGQEIKDLQKLLAQRGFYKGAIDGLYGPQTRKGLDLFNQARAAQATKVQGDIEARLAQNETNRQLAAYQLRQRLSVLAEELKAAGLGDRDAEGFRKLNPDDFSTEAIESVRGQAEKIVKDAKANAAKKKAENSGVKGFLKRNALRSLGLLGALDAPTEQVIRQPYYAGKRAQLQGASWNEQVTATVAGLPGLGGLVSKNRHPALRQAIEDTNSQSERAALTEKGELASFGEFLSGRAKKKLKGESLEMYKRTQGNLGIDKASAPLDAALNLFGDPLLGASKAVQPLRALGTVSRTASNARRGGLAAGLDGAAAQLAGRTAFFTETRAGQGVVDAIEATVRKAGGVDAADALSIQKRVRGLAQVQAQEILATARQTGDLRGAITDVLAGTAFAPNVPLFKQAAATATRGKVGLGGVARNKTLRTKGGDLLRRAARPEADGATFSRRGATGALPAATSDALAKTGLGGAEVHAQVVAPAIAGMDNITRLGRVWEMAENSGNAALVEGVEKEAKRLFKLAGGTHRLATLTPEAEVLLQRLEVATAVAAGEIGDGPAQQLARSLSSGLAMSRSEALPVAERALDNVGLTLKGKAAALPTTPADVQQLQADIASLSTRGGSADLRAALLGELGADDLGRLRRAVDGMLATPGAADEASRILDNITTGASQAAEIVPSKAGLGRRAVAKPARGLLAMNESVPPSAIDFERSENPALNAARRAEAFDRWARHPVLGFDEATIRTFRREMENAQTEEQVYHAVDQALVRVAAREGVDEDVMRGLLAEAQRALREGKATMVDQQTGKAIDDLMTLAQRGESIALPDPKDIKRALDQLKAMDGDLMAKLRTAVKNAANGRVLGLSYRGEDLSLSKVFTGIHTHWKFIVVSNLYAPLLGAGVGFGATDGDFGDKLAGAGKGFAVGAVLPLRYLLRVPGIEEKNRYFLERGFTPKEWIPVLSKRSRTHGLDRPFTAHHLIQANADITGHIKNPHLVTVSKGWKVLGKKDSRFVDAWWRIVNHQFHAETDAVAEILLKEKAGLIARKDADAMLKTFLRTDDGKIWLRRMRGGHNGPKTQVEAITRYRAFVDAYIPDAGLAQARLNGPLSHEELKSAVKAGSSPEFVHAQDTFRMPRNFREVGQLRDTIAKNFVFEGPTTKFNRKPLAEWIYRDEYERLVRAGVDPEKAQRIAEDVAVTRTNEVMFNVHDESRFAKKVDFVFPFQQPREEIVRVWGKMIARHPGRTLRMARAGALALNAGKSSGMFRENDHGQWEMTVPGTAYLSSIFGSTGNMEVSLQSALFFFSGAFDIGIVPSFGGPYFNNLSALVLDTEGGKQLFKDKIAGKWWEEILFPMGGPKHTVSPALNRMWMSFTHSAPPWELATKDAVEEDLVRREQEIARHLIWLHLQKHPGDTSWVPSVKEIEEATRASLLTQSFVSGLSPAPARPFFLGQDEWAEISKMYRGPDGRLDYKAALAEHPELEPYIRGGGKTEFTNPNRLLDPDSISTYEVEKMLGERRYRTADAYLSDLKDARKRDVAYKERGVAFDIPNPIERERALMAWREKYPEYADELLSKNLAAAEILRVMQTYPASQQPEALARIRDQYNLTPQQVSSLRRNIEQGRHKFSPWKMARYTEDVLADVGRMVLRGFDAETYVATLAPAEQVAYWNGRVQELASKVIADEPLAAQELLDEYYALTAKRSAVYASHKFLTNNKPKSKWEGWLDTWRGDYRKATSDAYNEAERLKTAMEVAKDAKDWKTYYALKERRNNALSLATALKNKQYGEHPIMAELEDEIRAGLIFAGEGRNLDRAIKEFLGDGTFIPSNEEKTFLSMPENVKDAYIQDLVDGLDTEAFEKGKKFWEWLTDFQRDLLTANMPEEAIKAWMGEKPDSGGKGGKGWKGRSFGGLAIGEGGGEIAFAIEMFKQFSKRGERTAPAAYAQYLNLPNNPAVRAQFLKAHPDVAEWVKLGPMANMPPVVRMMVANIMVKYGRWEGEEKEYVEVTELAFAQEMMKRWSRRPEGSKAPDTYDLWVNMPTGPEKAAYLKAHPEVENWIRLGPMANMPDEYRDVVRDVMMRYGEWTQRDDPLGRTIEEYYRLPAHARDQFLIDHPELTAYWAATRDPEDAKMFALADQYFSIQDVGAKRMFLAAHPELQSFFVKQRTKRYERFMNRVAQFMGANPEMFEQYLQRQEDVLAELLRRFAEPVLIREVPKMRDNVRATKGESGRVRRA